jgi:hypothetical protein
VGVFFPQRSHPAVETKQRSKTMKAWTPILVASAIVALAAPASYAATGHIPTDPSTPTTSRHLAIPSEPSRTAIAKLQAKIKALIASNKALAAKKKALAAKVKALKDRPSVAPPLTPPPGPGTYIPLDDCAAYMSDCTNEQLCANWGANCDLVPPPVTTPPDESVAVPPAEEAPVAYTTDALPSSTEGSQEGTQEGSAEEEC